MAEAGATVDPRMVLESAFSIEAGVEACHRLMGLDSRPTAIFALNDNTAVGAMSTLRSLGLSVPDDVSLVGYNDIRIASHLPVPLSTVRVPFDRIAASALDLLTNPPAAGPPRTRLAAPTLIPRSSTTAVAPRGMAD